jgi:fructokinase
MTAPDDGPHYRIGIDLGGTKAEIAALARDGSVKLRTRVPTPHGYEAIVTTLAGLVRQVEAEIGGAATVGVGIPGSISPASGLVRNANSGILNGHPLDRDLSTALGREVRVANDANCFALSEAVDGAAAGREVVFGVIIGTGCGGGVVVGGRVLNGHNGVGGEWGHNPLPWPSAEEVPGIRCWCGQYGCLETVLAGPSLARDCDGPGAHDASGLPARALAGDAKAQAALDRHADRLARALASVINLLDPDAIVLGGGLSNMEHLYQDIPRLLPRHVFSDVMTTPVLRNLHGDSSGVRGAAWLWPA